MNKMLKKENKKGSLAITQILILVIGIIAIAYAIGSSVGGVSAFDVVGTGGSSVGGVSAGQLTFPEFGWLKRLLDKPFISATSDDPGFFQRIVDFFVPGEGGAGKEFFLPDTWGGVLRYAGIAAGIAGLITFVVVAVRTGDFGRAFDSALRVGGAAGIGYLAGSAITSVLTTVGVLAGPAGWIISAAVAVTVWASQFLVREQQRMVIFQCSPWQAQTGGDDCGLCNNGLFPCTEYQCKSLGVNCELLNKDTDDPRCIHKDPRDVNPPEITVWEDALTEGYGYTPLPQGQYGVEIIYDVNDDGIPDQDCLPEFTPFTFGVNLDKEGYCKLSFQRTDNFDEMQFDFGGSNSYKIHHTQQMSFPGVANLEQEGIDVHNGGVFELYTRCEAANGKTNREEFLFKFCIDPGPDIDYPVIRGFNWNDESPVAYFDEGEDREVDVRVYVNEPSECKWDHEDKDYASMKDENQLTCNDNLMNFNAQLSYTCSGKLTGLENAKENKFYFRCKDKFDNLNPASETLTLIGTRQLIIDEVSPNEEVIRGSSDSIKVTLQAKTSAGYSEGKAVCTYSETGTTGSYVIFSDTDSHEHSHNLWLLPGEHTYDIRCIDLGGNSDTKTITFDVETDSGVPVVVRAYYDGGKLKLITSESAQCVYDTSSCTYLFEDGVSMSSNNGITHSVGWDIDNTLYVKCQDEYQNHPSGCSIILRPFEFF